MNVSSRARTSRDPRWAGCAAEGILVACVEHFVEVSAGLVLIKSSFAETGADDQEHSEVC